jgi:hypothetical protein
VIFPFVPTVALDVVERGAHGGFLEGGVLVGQPAELSQGGAGFLVAANG